MKKESNDDKSSSSSARQNKRRNTFAVVDIPPNLTNKRQDTIKNNSDLFNKSFDDINESKYHVRTRSMSHSQSDPTSQIRFSICKIEPTSTVPKSESLPTESTPFTNKSQSVKKQKIRFDDSSIKSPSKKRNLNKSSDELDESKSNKRKSSTILKKSDSMLSDATASVVSSSSYASTVTSAMARSTCCPVAGCNSTGHLSGYPNSKHSSYDMCPIYHKLTSDECNLMGPLVEKEYFALIDKLDSDYPSLNSLDDALTEEKLKYRELLNETLSKKLVIENEKPFKPIENTSNIAPDVFASRSKNLSSTLILNSLTNSLNTKSKKRAKSNTNHIEPPLVNDLDVSEFEFNLFKECLVLSAQTSQIDLVNGQVLKPLSKLKPSNSNNKIIQFGDYEIESWFKSPYPDDIWQQEKFFICQFCLKYIKSVSVYRRHMEKCLWKFPPGREIYRKDVYSFFEIDGNVDTIYCQNLCLLAKLFLDHKTLYLEVEPFLFYVLTKFNPVKSAYEMMGYFSKEKESFNNYNLSCILTLPQYMNQGYGRFLIDFSYLLTRTEGKTGSPEKPLSDLGLISYRNYWISIILQEISKSVNSEEISIKDLSSKTGITMIDIVSTLQYIGLIKYWKGKHVIVKNQALLDKYTEKRSGMLLEADAACLKWIMNKMENNNPSINTYDSTIRF